MKQIIKQSKFKSKEKITKIDVTGDTMKYLSIKNSPAVYEKQRPSVHSVGIELKRFLHILKNA